MTYAQPYAPQLVQPPASGRSMAVIAVVTLAAPLVAAMVKMPSSGWLMFVLMLTLIVWVIGYAVLAVAVSMGMLRRQGSMRVGAARIRATVWALLTSVGIVLLGFTLVDGGDAPGSVQSTLTIMLGAPESGSAAHEASSAIAWGAGIAWVAGYIGLLVEWIVGMVRGRGTGARAPMTAVAPPRIH